MRPLMLVLGMVAAAHCVAADQAITLIDDACLQERVNKCIADTPQAASYQPRGNANVREIEGVCKPGYAWAEVRNQAGVVTKACFLHDPDVATTFRSSLCRERVLSTNASECRHQVSLPGAK